MTRLEESDEEADLAVQSVSAWVPLTRKTLLPKLIEISQSSIG